MSIVSKVTWRYMKKNKKRTLVTMFGVIISVAMITAVLTSIGSFLDLFLRREIENGGAWMAEYDGIDQEGLDQLYAQSDISAVMLRTELGYSPLPEENMRDMNKQYLYIEAANAGAMKDMGLKVSQGRLPEAPGEIAISNQLLADMGDIYAIGDEITLDIGHREMEMDGTTQILGQDWGYVNNQQYPDSGGERFVSDDLEVTYTVVGFVNVGSTDYTWSAGYNAVTFLDLDTWPAEKKLSARVIFDHVDRNIYERGRQIAELTGCENFRMHDDLLRYYGVTPNDHMNDFLYVFAGFLIVLIVVGSVLLIYNAFAISLSERSRQLGMLSSVGATKAQKRRSVFFEGAVIGGISIPLGLVAGFGGMTITFRCISPMVSMVMDSNLAIRCVIRPDIVAAATGLAVLTIFISSWIPAARASRISPIDTIRQNKDIKLTRRKVKTSRLTRFLFRFEGDLAVKNMKRNKKGYRITVVSLVLSFTLFLGVAGYASMIQRAMDVSDNTSSYDVYVTMNPDRIEQASLCTSLDQVDDYNIIVRNYLSLYFKEADSQKIITQDYRNITMDFQWEDYGVQFIGMPREELEKYVASAELDASVMDTFDESLENGQIPVIFLNQYNVVTDSYQWAQMEVADVASGDTFGMTLFGYDVDGNSHPISDFTQMTVAAVTDQVPMGIAQRFRPFTDFYVITLDQCVTDMLKQSQNYKYNIGGSNTAFVYMSSSDPKELSEAVSQVYDEHRGIFIDYYSVWETEQSDRSLAFVMQVFCYGFIALMTLICIANILNTISTSIDLRRREFAMLKSVGMDSKAFNRMLVFESLLYGIKTLIYGIPLSILLILAEFEMMRGTFSFGFFLPLPYYIGAIAALFGVVLLAMAYSFSKARRENILDGLRTE